MKKRILFVDDEPKILDALRRLLRPQREIWSMEFVQGGRLALEAFEKSPYDVIVSDIRMPDIDGSTLLAEIQKRYPEVVRIALSGFTELETGLRALPVAHQFLSKPCDPKRLQEVIERACGLTAFLQSSSIQKMVSRIPSLPCLPEVYHQLMTLIASPEVCVEEVAALLEQDMALSAKILQVVNSSFVGLAQRITSMEAAVSYLGYNLVKNLVLTFEIQDNFSLESDDFSQSKLQARSLQASSLARLLLDDPREQEDAFSSCLLMDIGRLLLASELGEEYTRICQEAAYRNCPIETIELKKLGCTHAEVGAYLLGLWGMPCSVVEAVAYHHDPAKSSAQRFDVLYAVHCADQLVAEYEAEQQELTWPGLQLHYESLAELGVNEAKLGLWREMLAQNSLASN